MVSNGSKTSVSSAPPHELNVWKFLESRASELDGLHTIVAQRLGNDFRSQRNKRRRTTGHDDRVAKRKKFRKSGLGVVGDISGTDLVRKGENKVSRRVRRNIELKKNLQCGFGTSGDGTKRLPTHVWHAKRFTMKKLWGFYVPLGLHGRGRGSRALLKKLEHGVLVHDASYCGSVQLEGAEETLMSVLRSVLVPSPSACCEDVSHGVLAGAIFGTAMLHCSGKPIAPVTYMWRPLQQISTNTERLSIDDGTVIRQLQVWIHAAAFEEAYDCLSSACESQTDTTRSAHCVSREGQLAKLELAGSKVFQLLQKTLLPTCCNCEYSGDGHDLAGESEKSSFFGNGHQISSNAVVSMVVKDPRALIKKGNVIDPEEISHGLSSNDNIQIKEPTNSSFPKNEAECVLKNSDLWDASKVVCLPVEESFLCMEKHHRRNEFIRLGHKSSGPRNASVDGKYSRVCPVLLLKHEINEDSVARCSIILPLSWVKAFWITLMSSGAHAIGLREKHWVSCKIGLPYFPLDFPDCNAYTNFIAMEAVEINQKARLLPPSKRPLEVPLPSPWDCVHRTLEKKSSEARTYHSQAELGAQNEKNDDMEKKSLIKYSDYSDAAFEGIITRTSYMLSAYLNNISGNHLLLFPSKPDEKNSLCKLMRDKEFLKQDTVISEVKCGKKLCYLRVVLRACKEGVFEQGALVCAPLPADIVSWKASSESEDQLLQIPQSLLKSYFKQLPSGKWELQIPEDQTLLESYRWPIGFVTTGFVRGSKKATAGALCEASLLSMLREEQWSALPVRQRKEIYVLVRNLRSTAYRLALATIVLEQQEDDLKFM